MAKDIPLEIKRSPRELIHEESTLFATTKIWEYVMGSAPVKATMEEYCNSEVTINLAGLVVGIALAETKPEDKAEEYIVRASVNVMLPKEVRFISESIRQSAERITAKQ